MAHSTVNDAAGMERQVERKWELLADADIDDRDREAIEKFVQHRKIHGTERSGDYKPTTERNDLGDLRRSAERAETPLVDMGIDDVNTLLEVLQKDAPPKDENGRTWRSQSYTGIKPGTEGYGWGVTTGIDAYTRALRPFFKWLDAHNEYGDYPWWEQIKTGNVEFPGPRERTFPDEDDYHAMLDACRQFRNSEVRKAVLAFLHETGVRSSLAAQLRIKDIRWDGTPAGEGNAAFRPNPNGLNQKDVPVKWYPMWDGVDVLRVYVHEQHPDPDTEDAPLFAKEGYDPDNPAAGNVTPGRMSKYMRQLQDAAEIDEDVEVKPHAWRHAAVGRWKERGYELAEIQRRTAWKDKAAAEMWGRYGTPDDDKIDASIARKEGHDPAAHEEDDTPTIPERFDCGNCGTENITYDHCPDCGAAVSPEAKQREMERTALQDAAADLGAHAANDITAGLRHGSDDPEKIDARAELLDAFRDEDLLADVLRNNDDLMDAIAERIAQQEG